MRFLKNVMSLIKIKDRRTRYNIQMVFVKHSYIATKLQGVTALETVMVTVAPFRNFLSPQHA